MSASSKVVVLGMAAALLLQPLAVSSTCWRVATPTAACPSGCSMPDQKQKASPVNAQAADLACCEISSPVPAPRVTVVKGTESTRPAVVVPATAERTGVEVATAPALVHFTPPRGIDSSLNVLYCVFLL